MKKMLAAVIGLALMVPSVSMAMPILTLTEGATTVTVADGAALDSNPLAGVVTFIGSVGAFTINVTTGLGVAISPDPQVMDLNSIDATLATGGTLTLDWSDTYAGSTIPGVYLGIGGTIGAGGSLVYSFEVNDFQTGSGGPFGAGAFSETSSAMGTIVAGDKLSQIVTITHAGPASTSFNYAVTPVPEPSTMLLLGTGLLGLGLIRRRKQARS